MTAAFPTLCERVLNPTQALARTPHCPGHAGHQENLHGQRDSLLGILPGPSAIIYFCAKLKQCVVLAKSAQHPPVGGTRVVVIRVPRPILPSIM